jgi:hypothetical protein
VRLHTYFGLPWIRALVTYGNCFATDEFLSVTALHWELPNRTGKAAFVRQYSDDHYESDRGQGKRFAGPVGPVWVRDLWRNYPREVSVSAAGTRIGLLPKLSPDIYDRFRGTTDAHRLFYWFDKGRYKMRQGMTKTQEVWLGPEQLAPLLDRPLFAAPPPAWFRDAKVFGELSLDGPGKPLIHTYDVKVSATMTEYEKRQERDRAYGQFNFGDWWGERIINWGNIEYDTQHAFFLQFVRTGDYRFFARAEEAEVHNRDIDTVHFHRDPHRVGKVYAHCIGHVGNYYAKSPLKGRNRGTARGGFTVSHTWCEGHTDYYFLTGDRRSMDTARLIADAYDGSYLNNYDFTNCRIPGWHLILSMAVYQATGDPYYLNACRIIVKRVLERQTLTAEHGVPAGGWRRMLVPGHCTCTPRHYGNAGFMVGILLTGLRHYHEVTGDPAVAAAIRRGARYLIEDMWVPEKKGFRYTSCPRTSAGPWSNFLLFDSIRYAYRLQPDPLLARILIAGATPGIEAIHSFGKSFGQRIRVAPHSLNTLQALYDDPPVPIARAEGIAPAIFGGSLKATLDGSRSVIPGGTTGAWHWEFGDGTTGDGKVVTHRYPTGGKYRVTLTLTAGGVSDTAPVIVNVPPKELAAASPKTALLVEAERFSGQGGGTVKAPSGRIHASGKIVTGWHMNVGHWLEWTITLPAPGAYHLVLKYATDSPDTRREIRQLVKS